MYVTFGITDTVRGKQRNKKSVVQREIAEGVIKAVACGEGLNSFVTLQSVEDMSCQYL